MHVGWPQGIWFALITIRVLADVTHDGQPRTGTHNGSMGLLSAGLAFGLLYWGGFFA